MFPCTSCRFWSLGREVYDAAQNPLLRDWVRQIMREARAIDPFDASQAIAVPFFPKVNTDARSRLMLASSLVAAGIPTAVQGKCYRTRAVVDNVDLLVKGGRGWLPVLPHTGPLCDPIHTCSIRYGG